MNLLKEQLVALIGDRKWSDIDGGELEILNDLSDDELKVLNVIVAEEGERRGFGSYWWE